MLMLFRFQYWMAGPIGVVFAIIGVFVNLVAIITLAQRRVAGPLVSKRTFHLLMIQLSCWDLGYLILSTLCFSLPVISSDFRKDVSVYVIPYVLPWAQVCLLGSCYSTIALTVER